MKQQKIKIEASPLQMLEVRDKLKEVVSSWVEHQQEHFFKLYLNDSVFRLFEKYYNKECFIENTKMSLTFLEINALHYVLHKEVHLLPRTDAHKFFCSLNRVLNENRGVIYLQSNSRHKLLGS